MGEAVNCCVNNQDLIMPTCLRDVNYSCGSCGFELNLSSSNRNISLIGSQYRKFIKKGMVSFFSIDESRFIMNEQLRFRLYFDNLQSWGLFQRRMRLSCRKCGSYIGNACNRKSRTWDGICGDKVYNIKIQALQPSSCDNDLSIPPLFNA